jgi:two-component system chemotaxis sensor kinase CheA
MYQGMTDVDNFANSLISKLTPLVGTSYSAFYLVEEHGNQTILTKKAAYADNNEPVNKEQFAWGEGLVGQCAAQRQTIILSDIPEPYIRIRSAVMDAKPLQIILIPIEYEDRVLAVVELASLHAFTSLQQLLIYQVLNNAGVTIHSIKGQMRVQALLAESQTMTEELQSQSEELQLQQEELISINEKLEEQYRGSEQKSLELQRIKEELEDKANQLEQSYTYKSEFLANMSHELRTPLNSLLILAKILVDNEGGNLSSSQ